MRSKVSTLRSIFSRIAEQPDEPLPQPRHASKRFEIRESGFWLLVALSFRLKFRRLRKHNPRFLAEAAASQPSEEETR